MSTPALRPRSLAEAAEFRAVHADATVVHGGTDVMVAVNDGRRRVERWLSLRDVRELRGIDDDGTGWTIGAGVTFADLLDDPRVGDALPDLVAAARTVGSPQIRSAGTIGGNIVTASPAADSVPVLLCHDAVVDLLSASGRRSVPLADFARGPKQTVLRGDELVGAVRLDRPSGVAAFSKVGTRNAMVIAVCSLAARLDPATGLARVAIGSAAPTVRRCPDAEVFLLDQRAADDFADAVMAASSPIDDVRATAAYRRRALHVLARRMHAWLWTDLGAVAA